MRRLATPIGSPFSLPFRAPTGIRNLPLELQRNDLDPRRRALFQEAVAYYEQIMAGARPVPTMMPQRMLFQMHKQNNIGTGHRFYAESALSYGRVVGQYTSGVPNRVARAIPPPKMITPAQIAAAQRGGMMTPRIPEGQTQIVNRAVRANTENSVFGGRFKPPSGGVRSVANVAMALPVRANATVLDSIARTLAVVRR